MYRRVIYLSCLLFALYHPATCLANPTPMLVKHADGGYSPALRPYIYDVLKLTLDLTMEEYGPYRIQTTNAELSTSRQKIETEKGELLNVLFAAGWNEAGEDSSGVFGFDLPVFNDLLGLRTLLISRHSDFNVKPKNREAFIQYKAGQGQFWEDVKILRHNGVPVTEAHLLNSLFPMLEKGRFDYLPLSILEADVALNKKQRLFPGIHIASDI